MGQLPSSDMSSFHLWRIYHRSFSTPNEDGDADELFLYGYGDSDEPQSAPSGSGPGRFDAENTDEDDYPIGNLNANFGVSGVPGTNRQSHPIFPPASKPSLDSHMSESLESERIALESRYPRLVKGPSQCADAMEDLKRCYAHESDLLHCSEHVDRYADLARSVLNEKLVE